MHGVGCEDHEDWLSPEAGAACFWERSPHAFGSGARCLLSLTSERPFLNRTEAKVEGCASKPFMARTPDLTAQACETFSAMCSRIKCRVLSMKASLSARQLSKSKPTPGCPSVSAAAIRAV